MFIIKALNNEYLPVYGDGQNVRDWLYVKDNCKGIDLIRLSGKNGEIYNIGADNEHTNIEITDIILDELNKPVSLIQYVDDRLGHDRRYSIDSKKIKNLGWIPKQSKAFEKSLRFTIQWYKNNEWYWEMLSA